MKSFQFSTKNIFTLATATTLTLAFTSAFGAAFQVFEQGVISTSLAHADMAAGAYDATTAYYNPAGMTRLDRPQISGGIEGVELVTKTRYSTTGIGFTELIDPIVDGLLGASTQTVSHSSPGNGLFAPNLSMVLPVRFDDLPDMAIGLAVSAPWGLETNYDGTFASTYAKQTKIQAININPSVAIELFDGFSVGGGLDVQQLETKISSGIDILVVGIDAEATYYTWDVSWNVGLLYELSDSLRVGATYRPQMNYHQTGDASLSSNTLLAPSQKSDSTFEIDLPATTSFGIYKDMSERWSLMANAVYTEWDSIQQLTVQNDQPFHTFLGDISSLSIPFYWENSWFFSVGSSYDVTRKWTLRGGLGYDATPTSDQYREMRIPDADRYIFALGAGYEWNEYFRFDVGGQYILTSDVSINNPFLFFDIDLGTTTTDQAFRYTGEADSHAYIIGGQVTLTF